MPYWIGNGCTGCGECLDQCPVGAISRQGDRCVIDLDECIGCGSCWMACPKDIPVDLD